MSILHQSRPSSEAPTECLPDSEALLAQYKELVDAINEFYNEFYKLMDNAYTNPFIDEMSRLLSHHFDCDEKELQFEEKARANVLERKDPNRYKRFVEFVLACNNFVEQNGYQSHAPYLEQLYLDVNKMYSDTFINWREELDNFIQVLQDAIKFNRFPTTDDRRTFKSKLQQLEKEKRNISEFYLKPLELERRSLLITIYIHPPRKTSDDEKEYKRPRRGKRRSRKRKGVYPD